MADHPPQLTGTKVCRICGEPKPVIAFATDKKCCDGLKHDCRQCQSNKTQTSPSYQRRRDAQREAATRRARRDHNFACSPVMQED